MEKCNFSIDTNITLTSLVDEEATTEDFWALLFKWGFLKSLACISNLWTAFTLPIVIFNMIDFVSNRHIITIVHRMELGMMWSGMSSISLILFINAMRMLFGPLPRFVCNFLIFWRNAPLVGVFWYYNGIAIFRYAYIFVFKSVAPINEDFISRVVYLSVSLWAFLYGVIFMTLPGKMGINYYMCTGENPNVDYYSFKKFPINAIVPIASLLIYSLLAFKIASFKWKLAREEAKQRRLLIQQPSRMDSNAGSPSNQNNEGILAKISNFMQTNQAAVSFVAFLFVSIACFVHSILWSMVASNLQPDEIMTNNFAMFVVYWHNDFGPMTYVWIFMVLAYLKNPKLVQNAKELFSIA